RASACVALSFGANFAFAFVDLFTMIAIFALATRTRKAAFRRLLVASVAPPFAVYMLLSYSVVRHFPREQLVYGTSSLRETFSTVLQASLYRLNPEIVNPSVLSRVEPIKNWVLPLLALAAGCWFAYALWRLRLIADSRARWLAGFAALAVVIL